MVVYQGWERNQMLMTEQEYRDLLKSNSKIVPIYNRDEYKLGYDDAWAGRCPNPEYENDDVYMSGYDSAVTDYLDQYRY